jgi:glyceraldehyde-3-phosphate dehydrogenase/erythrose-4-phosphate dehydrogenase
VVVESRGKLEGTCLMVPDVLVTVIAVSVQATKALSFTFIWSFDHNDVYHLIQMVGIVLLMVGLKRTFFSRN